MDCPWAGGGRPGSHITRGDGSEKVTVGEPDATMNRIGEGVALGQRGERDAARELFAQVWSDIVGDDGNSLHRTALAHSMADVQDDVREELL